MLGYVQVHNQGQTDWSVPMFNWGVVDFHGLFVAHACDNMKILFLSLRELHEKGDARLGGYQSYKYWESQIVTSEWVALSDCGIDQPLIRKDMKYFKIKDFLEASSSKPVSSFPDYNLKGAEFAPIMKHVQQLLVSSRYIKGKSLYPPA